MIDRQVQSTPALCRRSPGHLHAAAERHAATILRPQRPHGDKRCRSIGSGFRCAVLSAAASKATPLGRLLIPPSSSLPLIGAVHRLSRQGGGQVQPTIAFPHISITDPALFHGCFFLAALFLGCLKYFIVFASSLKANRKPTLHRIYRSLRCWLRIFKLILLLVLSHRGER